VRILPGALGYLEHQWGFFLFASLDNGLQQLHIIHVKRAQAYLPFSALANKSLV